MIENRQFVSAGFEPIPKHGAEASWAGGELSFEQVESGGKRILVADDEELLRACLRMMLELEGHLVTEATNGAEALNLFKSGEFDLVITDFEMPVMQGDELAVRIKLLSPSLPVLMVTGSGRARPDARNPVDAVLSKPFNVGELHDALGKLFSAQRECAKSAP